MNQCRNGCGKARIIRRGKIKASSIFSAFLARCPDMIFGDVLMHQPEHLKSVGLKSTLPRLKVLSLFEGAKESHLSAEDVYRLLLASGDDVALATVYRVLTQFEQAGLLTRHHFDGDKSVFELNKGEHHDHIVCLQCGHVEEFYDKEIEARQKEIAAERGFTIHDHSLCIYADCVRQDCPHKKSV